MTPVAVAGAPMTHRTAHPGTPARDTRLDAYADRYATRTRGMTASEIRALFSVASRPEVVSLAGGHAVAVRAAAGRRRPTRCTTWCAATGNARCSTAPARATRCCASRSAR